MELEEIQSWKIAGKLAAQALQHGSRLMKPEVPVMDVLDAVEEYITKHKGGIAFPAQSSINNFAAHACPDSQDIKYKTGDVAKLDVGVHIDGYIADNAMTIEVGGTSANAELIKASRAALNSAISELKPGVNTRLIGAKIEKEITAYGYKPVVNLSGHGLGRWTVHKAPSFPNYEAPTGTILKEGMTFAIEPFASTGSGKVADRGLPTVFMHENKKPVRSTQAREVLKTIESYNGLPFTNRWLDRIHGAPKTRRVLDELQRTGIIHAYPPLVDTSDGLISQAEHCFILLEKPIILTLLDD